MENLMVSGFMFTFGHNLGITNVIVMGSCSVEDGEFLKLANLHSVHFYLVSRTRKRHKGQANLVVFCHGGSHSSKDLHQPQYESFLLKMRQEINQPILHFVMEFARLNHHFWRDL